MAEQSTSGMWRPLALAVGLVAVTAAGFWLIVHRAGDRYLEERGPAQWILYPAAFNPFISSNGIQTTAFRRTLHVSDTSAPAVLTIRGYGAVSVEMNGHAVAATPPDAIDIRPHLKAGENRVVVEVSNDMGPPALWLVLSIGGEQIVSDSSWESSRVGAEWLPSRPATEPAELRPGNAAAGGERSVESFRSRIVTILFFVAVTAAVVLGRERFVRWFEARAPQVSPRLLAVAVVAGSWLLLFA